MNKLLRMENKFQDYLLHANPEILQHVVSTSKVPADVRLGIYSYAYRVRLQEALMSSYPVLQIYLGYEQFEELCNAYIDLRPSQCRSIRWFGDQLAEFLRHQPIYKELPYLSELAQLEWTMALVFDAADSDVLHLEDMQHIPPEAWGSMQLRIHPSAHRLALSWNVVQIWRAIIDEQTPAKPQQSESTVAWILWRKELLSQYSSIPDDEAWAINAMIDGLTFGELCEGLCQWVDEQNAGMHAASLLKGWITAGLITDVIVAQGCANTPST